jgi:uncharacterized protein YndB with AHSA1/START domain
MDFKKLHNTVTWRLHMTSSPEQVFAMLATDQGRARFWAETANENDGIINWVFPNAYRLSTNILINQPPTIFSVEYIGGSQVTFTLNQDSNGGTELILTDTGIDPAYVNEVAAGWVSVLMALKAAVDFSVDLRNHDPQRTWEHGYLDN